MEMGLGRAKLLSRSVGTRQGDRASQHVYFNVCLTPLALEVGISLTEFQMPVPLNTMQEGGF